MPLTDKGDKIMGAMKEQYGDKKGTSVFYASKNKGTIAGVDKDDPPPPAGTQADIIVSPPRAPVQENDDDCADALDRFDEAVQKTEALAKRLDEAGKQAVTHEPGAPGEKGKGISTQP
jgi:hypothetical protein